MATRILEFLRPWAFFLGLLALAEAIIRLRGTPGYLLPAPSVVIVEAVQQLPMVLPHLAITMSEALIGFVAGNFCAILFGVLFSQLRLLRQGLYPVIVGLQTVPLVAIAPFIIIWFGPGLVGKAVMAGLICYFPATVISTDGFSRVNHDGLRFFRSLGASQWRIFWSLRFPSAIPAIMSALQVSATLCTVGAVVAELSGSSKGVGYLILRASYEFRTSMMFAVLGITSLAAFTLFKTVQVLGGWYARRYSFSYAAPTD